METSKKKELLSKSIDEFTNAVIEECYLVARGTHNFENPRFTRSQMYWKGRADAANDVRALKTGVKKEGARLFNAPLGP